MTTSRALASAPSAPHSTSTADNATAPSTTEASRPGSAELDPAPKRGAHPPAEAAKPAALSQRRPGPVDWTAQLARLDELRSKTGALPRGALVTLADELGVKVGTVYSQMSRRRRDEALREQGRTAALSQALADPSCSDPDSQATDPAQTSPQAGRRPHDRPAGARHEVLQRPDSEEAVLAVTDPREVPAHLADPEVIHSGSPSPAPIASHRVEIRCPGCAALLTLALADPTCSDPELIHSGSPSLTRAPTLAPTEPGLAPDAPCPRKTSP